MDPIAAGMVFQDRYEILAKLGEGGFGEVYRARQKVTQHEVAIKVLRTFHSTEEHQVARFQREMQVCAQLYHPNIVRLIDSGKAEPGLLYTVFEYVPGRTLAEVLATEGVLGPGETVHLMLQVLDALSCAHNQGVIHRDLKPQNIMLSQTGVRRNAMVLDFGLGTLASGSKEDVARITRTHEMLGTPTYAAPEQLRGEPVTANSDLYSWGLIFLECLTGQRAVEGATVQQVIFKQLGPELVSIPSWLEGHRLGQLLRKVTNKDVKAREVPAPRVVRELELCAVEGWPMGEGKGIESIPAPLLSSGTLDGPARGERRQLTAVCCHVSLSADGSVEEDEELDLLLRSLHASCAYIARRHGAHVGSVLGEWMLFYFGYPLAAEDDARRAARAALEMASQMERKGAELVSEGKSRLEFRAGIHTGLVISQDPHAHARADLPALVGSTPNVAVRMQARAEPGAILVSEATSKLLRGHFVFDEARREEGAGGKEGGRFRLLHEYRTSSTGVDGSITLPLYGRSEELDLLRQRWAQTVGGTGQSILLSGEPGIGKSRLVHELVRKVRGTPHTFLECRCAPEGKNNALFPVVELLESLLGLGRNAKPEQALAAIEALLTQHGFLLAEAMPLVAGLLSVRGSSGQYPIPEVSPQRAKELTLNLLVSLFFEMAEQQPLLLLVEDLHWADPTTLELLSQLIEDSSTTQLCLVLTARSEFIPSWPMSKVLQVQLSRLDRQRAEEMVSGLTQQTPLPREVVEQLVSRTDGVPLFLEELTRMVMDALPARGSETPSRVWTPTRLAIPTTLRDSLMARLDRLGPARETAQLAAALGREFSYEVLRAVSPRPEAELQRDLKALADADLVHRRRGVRNPSYLFKHALIRDTAYESMLRPLRREVHERIAAMLERHFPEVVGTRPDLLALHHAAADQKRQALDYAQKAAMGALMRSANNEAVAHASDALDWLEVVADERERAQAELGLNGIIIPARMSTHGWADERIKNRIDRSQQLVDALGDTPQVAPSLWALGLYHHTRGHRGAARAVMERLLAMGEQSADDSLIVMALCGLGHCLTVEGRMAEARECFERSLSLYDASRHAKLAVYLGLDPRAYAQMAMGFLVWMMGYADLAATYAQSALTWAEETKHPSSLALAYFFHLTFLQAQGARDQVISLGDKALEITQRYGLPANEVYCRMVRNWAVRDRDGLRRDIDELHQKLGVRLAMTYYNYLLAELEFDAQRYSAALAIIDTFLGDGRRPEERYYLADLLCLKGRCLQAQGESGAAEACLKEALEVAKQQSAKMLELKAANALSELFQARGQTAQARALLTPLLEWFTEGLQTPDVSRARTLLGQLAA
ncbi:TOMM system kinase/cyclase fusion protein [Stigmatella sp. ncwal1]|uniref:TOMM system kinase/cyclase fusion protein n=1 Tax=Stigmatella ashevillensis TaxID=2995309 RepID=A0ABT5DJX4_9BACT|nr:TOMM system kinase/cyclase fusion protein [Stigmatella ashevillena]MDC0713428.1 TOMM system kinase/cyclase fusion protein [Stigmatella ashevillena]